MFRCFPCVKSSFVKSIIARLTELSPETFSKDQLAKIAECKDLDEANLKKAILDRIPNGQSEIPLIHRICAVKTSSEKGADIQVALVKQILLLCPDMTNQLDPDLSTPLISACKAGSNEKLIRFFISLNKEKDNTKEIVEVTARDKEGKTATDFIASNFKEDKGLLDEMFAAVLWMLELKAGGLRMKLYRQDSKALHEEKAATLKK